MSAKIRVFELAEKLGKNPQDLRDELGKMGKPAHSNLSLVDAATAEAMLAAVHGGKTPAPAKTAKTVAVVEVAVTAPVEPVERSGVTIKFAIPKRKIKPVVVPEPVAVVEVVVEPVAGIDIPPVVVLVSPVVPVVPTVATPAPAPKAAAPKVPAAPRQLTSVNFDVPKRPKPTIVEIVAPERPSGIVRRDGSAVPSSAPAMGGPNARRTRTDATPGSSSNQSSAPTPPATPGAGSTAPKPGTTGPNAMPGGGRGRAPAGGRKESKRDREKRERAEAALGARPMTTMVSAPIILEGAPKPLVMPEGASISEMAQAMGVKASELIKKLMIDYKTMATVNQKLPREVVETLALDYGYEVQHEGIYGTDLIKEEADDVSRMVLRAPVVTIMGHVDHGKTTLLDAIRDTKVAAGESGGITQHIGAYKVHLPEHEGFPGGDVVFLDTPGHAAFTAMRARGAQATDIVVLVVAADDSVMPQTIEAIDHARAAGAPIVVAINKIDKEGANIDRVMQELGKHGLVPEEWGGTTIMAKLSAKKRQGVTELLELLALQAQVMELKADPGRRGYGVVVEAKLDKGRGSVASILIQKGTLKVGDSVLVGAQVGRVRALVDDRGKKLDFAGPSTPVELLGLSGVPEAGDLVMAVEDEKLARQIAARRQTANTDRERANRGHVKLEDLFDRIQTGDVKTLNVVIKGDVSGSVEALRGTLIDIKSDKVKARVIHGGVGNITESDVLLAAASDALIIAFNVKAAPSAVELAHKEKVEIRMYNVIYDAVNDVRDAMTGLLEPHFNEMSIGKGEVKQVFKISKGYIAGSIVTSGKITRDATVRFTRNGEKVWEGKPIGLKRFKDDVREAIESQECGISLDPSCGVAVGDVFEVLIQQEVAQKL